ncbi:MAG: hypothetical protein HW400_222 [Candidatus Levybacteria bacterium]|nr:hypothetical protein [Candidatus Levybacteria bacterium]
MDKVSELPMATRLETADKTAGKHENNPNSLRNKLLIATAVVVTAVGAVAAVKYLPTFLENRAAQTETIPTPPRLESANWQIMTPAEIKAHAEAPQVDGDILEGKKSIASEGAPISPILQEKAKAAGYEIIYQADPNDITGHSVLTTDRNSDPSTNSFSDGFGKYDSSIPLIKGIFKAWVPNPADPQQQDNVYALLENPLTKEDYLVNISLREQNLLDFTQFTVDDLNYGYADVAKIVQSTGSGLGSLGLPDAPNGPNKTLKDFPTFNDLVKKNVSLDNIMRQGDYIKTLIGGTTKDGVPTASIVIAERFGGRKAWEKEAGIK